MGKPIEVAAALYAALDADDVAGPSDSWRARCPALTVPTNGALGVRQPVRASAANRRIRTLGALPSPPLAEASEFPPRERCLAQPCPFIRQRAE